MSGMFHIFMSFVATHSFSLSWAIVNKLDNRYRILIYNYHTKYSYITTVYHRCYTTKYFHLHLP